jgi:hypothetical protein
MLGAVVVGEKVVRASVIRGVVDGAGVAVVGVEGAKCVRRWCGRR